MLKRAIVTVTSYACLEEFLLPVWTSPSQQIPLKAIILRIGTASVQSREKVVTDMRIEINAGGIGGVSVLDYQTHMQSFFFDADSVTASFKSIKSNESVAKTSIVHR